jgi:outer membrane biosynthesis protein TonB
MVRSWALATVCFSLLATESRAQATDGPAIAEPTATAPKLKTTIGPRWLRRPTGYDVQQVFPGAAMRARQYSGDVTVECKVAQDGGLTSCVVVEETPQGFGFGGAGLKLAKRFKMETKTADGYPTVGGTVRIPLMLRAPL